MIIHWNPDTLVDGEGWEGLDREATIAAYEKIAAQYISDAVGVEVTPDDFMHDMHEKVVLDSGEPDHIEIDGSIYDIQYIVDQAMNEAFDTQSFWVEEEEEA